MGHSVSTWVCSECEGQTAQMLWSDVQDVGVPICSQCGEDMTLAMERWEEDSLIPAPEKQNYLVWNNMDPNDSFQVMAISAADAVLEALSSIGWCVSAEPYKEEEDNE